MEQNTSNPKNIEEHPNRGLDTKNDENVDISIDLEDIDTTIITYINDVIKPHVIEKNNVKINVPVLYAYPERWKTIRKDGVLRDNKQKLQIPLIAIQRVSMAKNSLNIPINKYLERNFESTKWNVKNKYDRFAIQNGITPSNRYVSVIYPDYYDITYNCYVWTTFQSQMNHVIEQISFEAENYWGLANKYKFRTSIKEYKNSIDLPDNKDKIVRSEFTMTVNAYIIPQSYINKYGDLDTTTKIRFTPKKLVLNETIVTD